MPVLDANLLVVLVSGDPRRPQVLKQLLEWLDVTSFHSPLLAQYEFANALTRMIASRVFPEDKVAEAINNVLMLPIVYHPISDMTRILEIAKRMGRQNAYDAAYIALAELLQTELWTLDGPLYRNAENLGFSVRLIQ